MAKAICELSENISKQDIIEYILPPIITILKDSTTLSKCLIVRKYFKTSSISRRRKCFTLYNP